MDERYCAQCGEFFEDDDLAVSVCYECETAAPHEPLYCDECGCEGHAAVQVGWGPYAEIACGLEYASRPVYRWGMR